MVGRRARAQGGGGSFPTQRGISSPLKPQNHDKTEVFQSMGVENLS